MMHARMPPNDKEGRLENQVNLAKNLIRDHVSSYGTVISREQANELLRRITNPLHDWIDTFHPSYHVAEKNQQTLFEEANIIITLANAAITMYDEPEHYSTAIADYTAMLSRINNEASATSHKKHRAM